jgi:hypothetical protein
MQRAGDEALVLEGDDALFETTNRRDGAIGLRQRRDGGTSD